MIEEVVSPENNGQGLKAVIANGGEPGIDGMTVKELNGHLLLHWPKIQAKLMAGTYVPSPVRRVEIPKPNGGTRTLGIPTVLDRFIQQMLMQAMTPIWEPRFSEHSYGFRPGRSAHDAVEAAQRCAEEGKDQVADLDVAKCLHNCARAVLPVGAGAVRGEELGPSEDQEVCTAAIRMSKWNS